MVVGLHRFLINEMRALCSDPCLLNKDKESLSNFSWDGYEHMDDVSLHTYIHAYIHRYCEFTICYSCIRGSLRLTLN